MPTKGMIFPPPSPWLLRSSPFAQWRFGVFTALVFVGMLLVYSIDECTIKSLVDTWRPKQLYGSAVKVHGDSSLLFPSQNQTFNRSASPEPNPAPIATVSTTVNRSATFISQNQTDSFPKLTLVPQKKPGWISVDLEPNFTSKLLSRWLAPGGEPCRDSKTDEISIPGLDNRDSIQLPAGEVHEFSFTALDSSGKPRCLGGDYFETDLSGESWKSRPVVKDFQNGSYSLLLQVHPDFAGDFSLTVILLFRHFEGLKLSPPRFVVDKQLRNIRIKFYKTETKMLPELKQCRSSDFSKDVWVGRWTRHGKNNDCQISNDGRFRCLPPNLKCKSPWCNGSLGVLESNGWVYSAHCSFQIFSNPESAWNCLKGRWIFFWGDSNHVDTIRNMLNFMLGLPEIKSVPRRFDLNFSNPRNPSETVRITSIFNGHSNETMNYEGLDSLQHGDFRSLLWKYFLEEKVPDTMIMNSGLHDGIHFRNVRAFSKSAAFAAKFWGEIMASIKKRGLKPPEIFYRTTVTTGGYARSMAFNPSKMETFNGIVVDKFREVGIVSGVIDDFDITYPWHFDLRCNDGVHYGRGPAKMKWRDGEIGHQYFVDLMLGHILLNVLCLR